jgi:hypothetical protein
MIKYFGLPPLHPSELGLPGDQQLFPCCTPTDGLESLRLHCSINPRASS